MDKRTSGVERYDLCYGSGIADAYRYTSSSAVARISYYAKNFFFHRNQYRIDSLLPKIIDDAYHSGLRMYDTARAYGGSEYAIGKRRTGADDEYRRE